MALVVLAAACTESVRGVTPSTSRPAETSPAASTASRPTTAPATSAPTTSAPGTATPARTPAGSGAPTSAASPTLPSGASLPPLPSQPALPSGTSVAASGTTIFAIGPGETRTFDPADLARGRGLPPTATLVWTIAWRATDSLSSAWYRQESRTDLGRGRWGTADLGGSVFELRNDGASAVYGELAYAIGTR